nr:hypothetical protein [Tanacetum cinerariifolium]
MGDEHLSTISETEFDKFIKSSVENLVPNPSEFEDLFDIKIECDVPVCDDFTTFSNLLFDADEKFSSSNDESFSDEDIPKEIYSNPFFDEEIISIKTDPHHFNANFDLIESLLNQGSLLGIIFELIRQNTNETRRTNMRLIHNYENYKISNQTIDELPQALPIFHPTFHSEAESPFTLDSTPTYVDESPNVFNPPPQPPVAHHDLLSPQKELNMTLTKVTEKMTQLTSMCELACQIVQKNLEERQLEKEQAVKAQSWKLPVCYDDDDDEEGYNSLNDNIISELPPYSAATPTEPVDSLIMEDEHLNTISATKSDKFIKSCVENLVPNQ